MIGLCDAVFTFDVGQYVGSLPVGAAALIDGPGVVSESYGGLGIEVEPLAGTDSITSRTLGRGMGRRTVLSRDRTVGATVLEANGGYSVRVFSVPALDERSSAPIEPPMRETDLGFLADGTLLVLANHVVSRIEAGKLVAVRGAPEGLLAMRVASGGTTAVVVRKGGQRVVVELPSWREMILLPPAPDDETRPLDGVALSDSGRRVAFSHDAGLSIAEIAEGARVELHREVLERVEALTFSPDEKTVLAKGPQTMTVFRENAPIRPRSVLSYAPLAPKGFELVFERGGRGDAGDGIERWDGGEELLEAGVFVRYRNESTTVTVSAFDAAEFGDERLSLAGWAAKVIGRDVGLGGEGACTGRRSWRTDRGRALEYAQYRRDGCDPTDNYVHVEERGGLVYRVEVEVAPGTPRRKVLPYLQAFFDGAFAAPRQKRDLAEAPAPRSGPC